jgi:hypothetical protein
VRRKCGHQRKTKKQKGWCAFCKPEQAYKGYKKRATKKGRPFELTLEEFILLVNAPCFYCGNPKSGGVDRCDNKAGYEFLNCRSCCGTCNRFKFTYEVQKFIDHCRRVARHTSSWGFKLDVMRSWEVANHFGLELKGFKGYEGWRSSENNLATKPL